MLAERCGGRLLLPGVGALFAARTDGRVRGPVRQPADREVRLDPAVRGGWQKGVRHEDRSCLPLTPAVLAAHLKGEAHIGLYPLLDGDRCWWVAADFDGPEAMFDALMYVKAGRGLQVPVALEVSRSGVGAHAWVFFTAPVPAELARRLGTGLLREAMALRGRMTLASYDRLFASAGRCRGDQPVRSQPSRQEPDQRGHHRPVGPVQLGPQMGPAQHSDLMPQHQELGVLGGRRPAEQDKPAT